MLTEVFHANSIALVPRLQNCFPGADKIERADARGRVPKGVVPPA